MSEDDVDDTSSGDSRENEGPLTPDSLQAKLNAYHKAMREEFELAEKTADTHAQEEATIDFLKKHVPVAAAQIVHLMQFSTSDSVRASMSKYVIERVFKCESESGDPIKDLLDQLKANPGPNPRVPRS